MAPIPFPLSSAPGLNTQESGGRLINAFAEPLQRIAHKGAPKPAKYIRVPGMEDFATSSQTGFRGMFEVGGTLYVAFKDNLYTTTTAGGALAFYDGLPGTGTAYFARNNSTPPDIVVVTDSIAYIVNTGAGTVDVYPDADLPSPLNVFSLDGYFLFPIGDGSVYASNLNATSVDPASFADINTKPDAMVRGCNFGGSALLFGTQTLEVWQDLGLQPFPLQRSTTVPFGLLAADAMAGWEDGFGSGLLWVSNDCCVRTLNGYAAEKVSPPDLDRLIQRDASQSTILASVHVVDGHSMWTITGTDWTWEFDLNTKKWHERASYETTRWRGMQTWRAFEKWLVGDRDTGNIYEICPTCFTEGDDPLRMRLESMPVEQFPARERVARADFNVTVGVGVTTGTNPTQTDPVMDISWSNDGGENWSNPLIRELGEQAKASQMVTVTRTGLTGRQGRRWRLDISDPVYLSIFGGDQSIELRR